VLLRRCLPIVCLSSLFACTRVDAHAREQAAPSGISVQRVQYALELRSGARVQRDGQALHIQSDAGYRIDMTKATLATHSIALVPCAPTPPDLRGASLWRALLPLAHAGHDTRRDASSIDGTIEDLRVSAVRHELGTSALSADRYCRVHYVLGGGNPSARIAGSAPNATSLALAGTFRAPSGASGELRVATQLAHGKLSELPRLQTASGSTLRVSVSRELDTLFDGLRLESLDEKALARALLTNLIEHTQIRIELAP
jgi:hypothetical protein